MAMPSLLLAQSEARIFANGEQTSVIVPSAETYTVEFPINSAEASKTFNTPMATGLSYTLFIGGGDESVQLDNLHSSNEMYEGTKNWKKFAKAGGVIKQEVDGRDINDALRRLKSNGWPDQDYKVKIWITATANLKGDVTVMSEGWINIPKSLKSEYYASKDKEVLESFQRGSYSGKVSDPGLGAAIEKYVETKWPPSDLTTVNIQSIVYTNTARTNYRFECSIIFSDKGVCKYNMNNGTGVVSGGRYSVSSFNAGQPDKVLSCDTAGKLKNK